MSVAPKFLKKPSLKQEGTSVVFNCEIEASPAPTITWYRGDAKLESSERLEAKAEAVPGTRKFLLSLVIQNVGAQDSGSYKVEAKNAAGQMAANVNLNLQGRPTLFTE